MRKYTERVNFTLPAASKQRLKAAAWRQGISMSELIRRRVRQYMDLEDKLATDTRS